MCGKSNVVFTVIAVVASTRWTTAATASESFGCPWHGSEADKDREEKVKDDDDDGGGGDGDDGETCVNQVADFAMFPIATNAA